MALAIHGSTPTAVTSDASVSTLTTAAFTPPTGAVLLMVAIFDTTNGAHTGTASTVTGSTSAWTTVGNYNNGNGLVHISWARVTTSQSTTARVTWSAASDCAMKVWVVTGGPVAGSPIGASGSATLSTNPQTVSYTASVAGSQGFLGLEDASHAGAKTISNTTTFATLSAFSNGVVARDSAQSGSAGETRSFSVSGTPGGASVGWAELLPATQAVLFRSSADDNRGTAASSIVALPAGVVEGDYLIAIQSCDINGSLAGMTAPAGWTERGSTSRSDVGFMKVWTKVATASEPSTYTFTDPAGAQDCTTILALTGQDAAAPLAVTPTFSTGATATAHPAPSVAGVASGLLVTAHLAGTAGTTRSYTPPTGMTERSEVAASSGATIAQEVNTLALTASGQTGTKSATCSASTPYITMSLVVAPVITAVTTSPDTPDATGQAYNASARSNSAVTAGRGSAAGAANAPTISSVSRTTAVAGRGSATGAANNASVATSSSTSTTVTAGATASGMAYGSNTGTVFGFDVAASVPPGAGGLFPSETLFPSEGLFPSAGDVATVQTVSPPGIGTAEAVGSPVVALADGSQSVVATSIDPGETFGVPTVSLAVGPQDVTAAGIDTAEAFGRPTATVEVAAPPPPPLAAQYLDTYYVDGIDLAQFTTQIEIAEGLADTPGSFGDDVVLPGRDGLLEVWGGPGQQRRADGPGKWVASMWLLGVDPTTGDLLDPAGSAAAYQARWDELVRMFHRRRITIDHPRQDGTRRAVGYLTPGESMTPTDRRASPWFGRFKASVTIPAGHWTDQVEVTTGPTSLATNGTLSLSPWATATAPCTELTITFGPGNNPRLSTSYGFVGWNGTIAAGRQLVIDTATGQLGYGAGAVWAPDYGGLIYSPGPRLFEIDPSEPLQAILTHTGGGSMSVEVAGRRRYRTS